MDGEYQFRPRLTRDLNESLPLYTDDQVLEVSIDGVRAGLFTLPGIGRGEEPARPAASSGATGGAQRPAISQIATGPRLSAKDRDARNRADETWNLRVPVKAGQRDVAVTFVNRTAALDETPRLPFLRPYPAGVNIPETRLGAHLRSVEIEGPLHATGPGDTTARAGLFQCRPPSPASAPGGASARLRRDESPSVGESACARRILTSLATRAYRRPARAGDVEPLLAFYREGLEGGTFDRGIERAVRRLLVSPEFLFRVERDPAGVTPGAAYRITDLELASRLSFFLWSSIPDDELIAVAARGALGHPAVLDRQVRRMLAEPEGRRLREQLRRPVAVSPQSRRDRAGPERLPGLRRRAAPGLPPRDGAVRREHPARGPQRARSAAGRLHVSQRAAGAALRRPEHRRAATSAA